MAEGEENAQQQEEFDYNQVDPLASIGYSAEPGDIYYMNPPQELSTYPIYIENPSKKEKTVGSFISYTLNGTDITEQTNRRYSDFYSLYEKLLQRWPGVYVPRIPPKQITGNMDRKNIKTRMRLLNRFCLNLSSIDYLYNSEEAEIFKKNTGDIASTIDKIQPLNYSDLLAKYREVFPNTNENYDIIIGKGKIREFDLFLKKSLKNIDTFQKSVDTAAEKKEIEKKKYCELIQGFTEYEKKNMSIYADENEGALIFTNSSYPNLTEKVQKLSKEMINPFNAFKDWLDEETLDVEAMCIAIKQIEDLMSTETKLQQKLDGLENDIKKMEGGGGSFFKTLFKKKEDVLAGLNKDRDETSQKLQDVGEIIKIVADNMENQIEEFKNQKTSNYYRYLKIFAILQRESNRVVRELWELVKTALTEVAPNAGENNEDYVAQPMSSGGQEEGEGYGEGEVDGEGGEEA